MKLPLPVNKFRLINKQLFKNYINYILNKGFFRCKNNFNIKIHNKLISIFNCDNCF